MALLLAGQASAGTDAVFGRWLVEDGRAVIEIEPCGAQACGRLVWMRTPTEPDGSPKRDLMNPDPAQRMRPLCGSRIVSGLSPAGDGSWTGGEIYSARDGRSYGFSIAPAGPDRLAARGYLGLSLLGSTQSWVRAGARHGNCTTLGAPGADR